ncbi:MAG: N-acetylmuramoyl-L-alanine amidase [Frankiales bacterium]|nr:N-acetylmuramoyl-L-alanine amidase [Frankiales bacterium]
MNAPAIRRGDTGTAVAEIRDRLGRLGLLTEHDPATDPLHARFDDTVDAAVRCFQQERGLTVDGVVGGQTFRRLEEARWSLGDRVLSYSPGHVVAGDDVLALQRRLAGLGFDLGRVDGVFGVRTDTALREFQRSVGVDPDGTCGPETFRALGRLGRTMSGGGTASVLRELHALEALCSGVADKVVVIDPGHGGLDDGRRHGELSEATVAGDLALRVEGRLAAIGVQVLLTRSPDSSHAPEEAERAAFANDTAADLVLSLHADSVESPVPGGCATFYFGDPVSGAGSTLGHRVADMVQEEICARTDLTDCRTHAKTWDLLRMTRMPAVRIECGYLSNPRDAARLSDPGFRDAVAEGISAAVVRFFAPVPAEA